MEKEQLVFITEREYNELKLRKSQLEVIGDNLDRCIKLLYPDFDDSQMQNNITIWLNFLSQVQLDGVFHNFEWKRKKRFF